MFPKCLAHLKQLPGVWSSGSVLELRSSTLFPSSVSIQCACHLRMASHVPADTLPVRPPRVFPGQWWSLGQSLLLIPSLQPAGSAMYFQCLVSGWYCRAPLPSHPVRTRPTKCMWNPDKLPPSISQTNGSDGKPSPPGRSAVVWRDQECYAGVLWGKGLGARRAGHAEAGRENSPGCLPASDDRLL